MNLYDIAIARKLSGGGGGGGSSDFSIATVSFVIPEGNSMEIRRIVIENEQLGFKDLIDGSVSDSLVLYKGSQTVLFEDSAQLTPSTNVEILSEDYYDGTWAYEIAIKGDCELHITGWSDN